jgi:hypothetical protein
MNDVRRWLEVLGLEPGATKKQLDLAYRDLVKVWHPDRFESDPALRLKAQEKLRELNVAYEGLRRSGIPPADPVPPPRPETRTQARPAPAHARPATSAARFARSGELRMFGAVMAITAAVVGLVLFAGARRDTVTPAPTDIALAPEPATSTMEAPDPPRRAAPPPDAERRAAPERRTAPIPDAEPRAAQPPDAERSAEASVPSPPAAPVDPLPAVAQPASPPKPAAGALAVLSQPAGATIYLNGAQVGRTPLTLTSLEPGVYRLRLELASFSAWSSSVRIEAGSAEKVIAFLESPRSSPGQVR